MVASMMDWLQSLPFWVVYIVILVLTAVIYQTAFARPLPLLKQAIVYVFLALGCFLLVIFHLMELPIIPALFITVVLIVGTRARLSYLRKKEQSVAK
ncbi:YlaH-like family protein [Risungbinella massiliensis]|uniref:YlaH-like family protein n=1 Tax=Risungbinella massiliensis TaxID=1329796 RepID=UPI0005CC0422|nr:YlaH-like family protein [Risungbinella massiliensis]